MANYYDICNRWIDIALGRTTKQNYSRNYNIFGQGDHLYSYGTHFELARVLRDRKDNATSFLLNGDVYSVTTSRHQSEIRNRLDHRTSLPRVVIPFSALSAANIDLGSVEIIEATKDGNETITNVTYEQPANTTWTKVEDWGMVDLSDEELSAVVDKRNADAAAEWSRKTEMYRSWVRTDGGSTYGAEWLEKNPAPKVITVDDLGTYERSERRVVGHHMVLQHNKQSWRAIKVEKLDDGRTKYSWDTYRHWLGESLIRAKVRTRTFTPCKACKGTGRTSLKRERYHRFDHGSYDEYAKGNCTTCDGSGGRDWHRNRYAFFLSGFDANESRPVYFFCELPKGVKPKTVAEAYEALKPETVKLAEQMGRTVLRQGDIFAIELRDATKRELRKRGARFEKRGQLFGTNHVATETAYLPDGTTLVRGTLHHVPDGRTPDHARLTVGKSWHIAIKNTVPTTK